MRVVKGLVIELYNTRRGWGGEDADRRPRDCRDPNVSALQQVRHSTDLRNAKCFGRIGPIMTEYLIFLPNLK